ncbi:MAG: AIM24 family protein [Lachnospiraceae bacterium]|nr:AIM24 family protein [Lachnospiraceae bacterium]
MVTSSLLNSENVVIKSQLGEMQVVEYAKDMSVNMHSSKREYYAAQMNINRRQLLINMSGNVGYTLQAGAMQWMSGNIQMGSGVKGVGDFLGKFVASKVTKESAVKPEYVGNGQLMLEPTYRHILLTDLAEWGGSVVLDDGLFLACQTGIQHKVVARSNVTSAVFGGEGLFNLSLNGSGIVALESIVPREELFEFELNNDVLKIDGNMAVAWSGSLEFTVEKSAKGLISSAVSGEGFVNVYRGTGKVWMAPVLGHGSAGVTNQAENASAGNTGSAAGKVDTVSKGGTLGKIAGVLDFFS